MADAWRRNRVKRTGRCHRWSKRTDLQLAYAAATGCTSGSAGARVGNAIDNPTVPASGYFRRAVLVVNRLIGYLATPESRTNDRQREADASTALAPVSKGQIRRSPSDSEKVQLDPCGYRVGAPCAADHRCLPMSILTCFRDCRCRKTPVRSLEPLHSRSLQPPGTIMKEITYVFGALAEPRLSRH